MRDITNDVMGARERKIRNKAAESKVSSETGALDCGGVRARRVQKDADLRCKPPLLMCFRAARCKQCDTWRGRCLEVASERQVDARGTSVDGSTLKSLIVRHEVEGGILGFRWRAGYPFLDDRAKHGGALVAATRCEMLLSDPDPLRLQSFEAAKSQLAKMHVGEQVGRLENQDDERRPCGVNIDADSASCQPNASLGLRVEGSASQTS